MRLQFKKLFLIANIIFTSLCGAKLYHSSADRLVPVKVVRNSHIRIPSLSAGSVLRKVVRNIYIKIRSQLEVSNTRRKRKERIVLYRKL